MGENMDAQSQVDRFDPRGLIRESYRIPGIDSGQCRTVFLDWVLGAKDTPPLAEQIRAMVDFYADRQPDHPMSAVLHEGLSGQSAPQTRRGGWRGRER